MDNIPILSWMVLRARCRACRRPIPWRYPAVELATAALFLLSFLEFRITILGIGADILCFLLLGLAAMDAETMRLPDTFTLPGLVLGVLDSLLRPASSPLDHLRHAALSLLAAIVAALALLAIRGLYYAVRHVEGMGMGDIKLIAMIAAWLGLPLTLLTLLLGTVAAALFGILLLAASPRPRRPQDMRLPFGSFLCAAALYSLFAGEPLLRWYMQFFP